MGMRSAKRMKFNANQKRRRRAQRISKRNKDNPSFLGVVHNFEINGKKYGMGALFINPQTNQLDMEAPHGGA